VARCQGASMPTPATAKPADPIAAPVVGVLEQGGV
jgi:hypothetical protein